MGYASLLKCNAKYATDPIIALLGFKSGSVFYRLKLLFYARVVSTMERPDIFCSSNFKQQIHLHVLSPCILTSHHRVLISNFFFSKGNIDAAYHLALASTSGKHKFYSKALAHFLDNMQQKSSLLGDQFGILEALFINPSTALIYIEAPLLVANFSRGLGPPRVNDERQLSIEMQVWRRKLELRTRGSTSPLKSVKHCLQSHGGDGQPLLSHLLRDILYAEEELPVLLPK